MPRPSEPTVLVHEPSIADWAELAIAVADELESAAGEASAIDSLVRDTAKHLATSLRVIGWAEQRRAVERRAAEPPAAERPAGARGYDPLDDDEQRTLFRLFELFAEADELLGVPAAAEHPPVSGPRPQSGIRERGVSEHGVRERLPSGLVLDDDETVVSRTFYPASARMTNRALGRGRP